MEIRLRSISATSPNAKQSTLLLIVSSKEYFSLVVYRLIPRLRHLPMIPMMSVSVRLRRDISVTISVSPLFMRFSNRPSLRSFSFALPLTTSVTQLVITNSLLSAKRLISSC